MKRLRIAFLSLVVLAVGAVFLRSNAGRLYIGGGYIRLERVWWGRGWPNFPNLFAPVVFGAMGLPARVEVQPGISFFINPYDLVPAYILADRQWEPLNWKAISGALRDGAVMLDVGAHIGYFSIKSSRVVGSSGRVIAFEPNPETLKLLRGNVSANDARNVTVEPVACSDHEGILTLYAGRELNTGSTSLSKTNAEIYRTTPAPAFTVQGRPIDRVIEELALQRIDVIKIDVEGAEYLVLRGALRTLARFHPKIIVEIVPAQLKNMGAKPEDISTLFASLGYGQGTQIDTWNWVWTVR